ncbi:MAG: DUF4091 domain-containing protein [Acidobacteria bacterium]|nr:DUF4091 domain-containing protein [Acidobacteriota bacterium]
MLSPLPRLLSLGSLAVLALLFFAAFSGKTAGEKPDWWVTHAMDKVRPNAAPPRERPQAAELWAARNEFESFQIVLRAPQQDLPEMDITFSDLTGPAGAVITSGNITVYLEQYLEVKRPSFLKGETGAWPDPLVPRMDRYAREKRNAFPFTLRQNRNQPLWVELYIPPTAAPGVYRGEARLTAGGSEVLAVPIVVRVWRFALPSTSSLKTSFGLSGIAALRRHRGRYTDAEDLHNITFSYAKAALWHRISVHGGSMDPPPFVLEGEGMRLDWTRYDREVGPFLDGTVFSQGDPLPGAKATSVDLRTHGAADTDEKKVLYWKEWVRHFEKRGWLDRLFHYVWDEPSRDDYLRLEARAKLARQADSRLRNLVTTSLDPRLADVIDIWTPLVNCLESKPNFPDFCERQVGREAYKKEVARGKSLWWYQSCASHACGPAETAYFDGWPSYVIDVPAVSNRIMPWLAWQYGIQGELYYNMNEAYSRDIDPWEDLFLFDGNGEGTLFYPGRPEKIGGRTDVPIESIRLKLIREGLEDYEYMVLLSARGLSDWVAQEVGSVARRVYLWETNPARLDSSRRALGEKLDQLEGGADSYGRN